MTANAKNLIVTGTPGAWFNAVNRVLSKKHWSITWPGQDLDITNGRRYLESNGQNIEVYNIISQLCDRHKTTPWSDNLPRFYDLPYPGPEEFVAKFKGPVLISSIYLSAFLDIWATVCDTVIDIRASEDEDLQTLRFWTRDSFDSNKLKSVRDHHLSRYVEHLKLFPKVFTMTNAEVKDNRFKELEEFLHTLF